MNPVNRQYLERANLVGQRGLIGIYGSQAGFRTSIFQGVTTVVHPASGHFALFWTPMMTTPMMSIAYGSIIIYNYHKAEM